MLSTIINDPERQCSTLIVVLETDNVTRMEKADPITLVSARQGGAIQTIDYPDNFNCVISYEPDSAALQSILQQKNTPKLMAYLLRGYMFTPTDGKGEPIRMDGSLVSE